MENISEQFDETKTDDNRMMYEYDKRPTRDLAEREISEDGTKSVIPTDWAGLGLVQDLAMDPFTFSPISPFGRTDRVYSAFQSLRNLGMIKDAYGIEGLRDDEIEAYREKAAVDVKNNRDALIIEAAEAATKLNVSPERITNLLSTPPTVLERETGLEKRSIEVPTEEALESNLDLQMAHLDAAMKMKEDTTDLLIKARIAEQYIDRSEADVKNMGVIQSAMAILSRFLPGADTAKVSLSDPFNVGWNFLSIDTRKKQKEVLQNVMKNVNQDEWKIFLDGLYSTLQDITGDPIAVNDFWKETFGTASVAPALGLGADFFVAAKAAKGLGWVQKIIERNAKAISTAEKVGDTTKVLQEISEGLAAESSADIKTIRKITDTAMDVSKDLINTESYRAVSEGLTQAAEETKLFNDIYQNVIRPEYISQKQEERIQEAVRTWVEEKVAKTPNQNYYDYAQYSFEKDTDGNLLSIIDLATGSDGKQLFASQEAAEKFIKSSPFLKGEAEAIQEMNGWKVRVKLNVPEQGVVLGYSGWEKDKDWKLNRGVAFFRRTLGVPEEAHSQAYALTAGKEAAQTKLKKRVNNVYKNLSKKEKEDVEAVYRQTIHEASKDPNWERPSDDVLKNRFGLNDNQIRYYREGYKISDAALEEKNIYVHHAYSKRGERMLYIKGLEEGRIGKAADKMNKEIFSRNAFIDITKLADEEANGGLYKFGELTENIWKGLEEKGYVAVKLHKPDIVHINGQRIPVKYYIGPREDITSKELPYNLLGYHPEGSRGYTENAGFLKQPNIFNVDGNVLIGTSHTIAADVNPKVLEIQKNELNSVLPIYRKYAEGSLTKAEASIQVNEVTADNKYVKFANIDDMEKNIGQGKLIEDYRYDFEVVRHNEELRQVAEIRARGGIAIDDDIDYADTIFDLSAKDKRGKGLLTTLEDGEVPIVGFSDMIDRNINAIGYNKFTRPYIEYMGRELRQQFSDVIKPQYLNLSDDELLRSSDIFKDIPAGSVNVQRVNAAKNLQQEYKLRTGVKTDFDRYFEDMGTRLAESLGLDKDLWVGQAIEKINPNKLVKSWNWLNTMGWWNIRQALVQANGAYNAVLITPKQASRIASRYMPLRAALAAKTPEQLEEAAKAVSRFGLIKEEEAKGLINHLKRVGVEGAADRLSMYESINAFKGLSDSATMFYREGEKFNAVIAQGAAYLEYIAEHPEVIGRALTNEELLKVAGRGDYIYLAMGRNASSAFEKNALTSALAQFTSYGVSCVEALIGRQLSNPEKLRLLLGNVLAFGTAGTFGGDQYNFYGWLQEQGVNDEVTELLRSGGVNGIIRALGGNIDVKDLGMSLFTSGILGKGKEALDGKGVVDLVKAIPASNGMRVLADLPGTIKEGMSLLIDWVDPKISEQEFISDLKAFYTRDLPSSIGNYTAAYLMYKTGKVYDKKGRITQEDPDAWDIWGRVFGFKRDNNAVYRYVSEILDDSTLLYKDIAESLRTHFIRANDRGEYEEYAQLKETLLYPLSWHDRDQAEVYITDMEREIEDLDTTLYKYWEKHRDKLSWETQERIQEQLDKQGVKVTW